MNAISMFREECTREIVAQSQSKDAVSLAQQFMGLPVLHHYSYHFSWLGRPIIQYPQDIIAMQELIFSVQPDLIIETGIAHGGYIR